MKGAGPPRPARQHPADAFPAELAHALRASLNAIRTWSHVLRERLAGNPDPVVARALEGIHAGVDSQVRAIENLLEGDAVQPPLEAATMSKRKDVQPDIPEDPTAKDRPTRPEPLAQEQPGGREAAKAERDARNKTTREGER